MNYPSDNITELQKIRKIKVILNETGIPDTYKLDMIRKVLE